MGIGTTDPDPSALLELESDSQGMLTPRMTSDERNEIISPATGLLVFDTDLNVFLFFNGSTWQQLSQPSNTGWVALNDGDYFLDLPGISINDSENPENFTDINLNFTNHPSDNVIESFAPTGVAASDFFDNSNSRITPINLGDSVEVRLQFDAIPDANNSFIVIAFDIATTNGIVIFQKTVPLLRGSGDLNKVSESILLYQLETFVANGAKLRLGYSSTSGSPGNVELSNFNLVITKLSGN
ncbi:hypothetical protein [Winogradskyella ouciana]|uniref:Uncharacterized protein n=1 Tax=Winogradskyella ouciana TaxID=2608631 RepID=A0A7K1GC01_9FLAO|nr:hypothetical protein [Winogradskyella ouciana]MTE25908.1 hypothetical protein [Winogradskyella ouciana]